MSDINPIDILIKEYEIIQGKIDKIGEFKFKIRGWSLTIQSAIIIAILTGEIKEVWLPIILLFIIPAIFHFLEYQQENISAALSGRALALEKVIDRIIFFPDDSDRKKGVLLKKLNRSPKIGLTIQKYNKSLRNMWIISKYLMYIAQYFLAVLMLFLFLTWDIKADAKEQHEINSPAGVSNSEVEVIKPQFDREAKGNE
jgi:hypothetical protein